MNFMVTGGTGNWGNYVTRLLLKEGGNKVVVYQRNPLRHRITDILDHEGKDLFIVPGDTRDMALLFKTCRDHQIKKVIHLANRLTPGCAANPYEATMINCIGTINVFETAKLLGMDKVVYASSGTTFGPPSKYDREFIQDDAPQYPGMPYSGTKLYQEVIANHYYKTWGVDIVGLRPGTVYSSARTDGNSNIAVQEMLMKPALGQPGKVTRTPEGSNWHFCEDAARAAILAAKSGKTKTRVFNILGDIRSWDDAIACVKKLIPDAKLTITMGQPTSVHSYDGKGAREELGYEPIWTMEKGFEQVIKDVRAGKV